ncbi:hypothetical protein FDP41_012899 [Naegleria fowleri]|uniref:AAA+ ATPase domain-containing protein n=1 Tax=Naegleria fowleri TaxID=5763 RepID=A0A6A5C261_NAEFO|nr:uncharacterized protein FDP41_012899 [Naegleria fowleri]KAF0981111.1 hypothetical protein FDP41_012899 [Naegleria fowleri]
MSSKAQSAEKSRAIKRPFQVVRTTTSCNDESLIFLDDATLKQYKLIVDQYTMVSLDYNCKFSQNALSTVSSFSSSSSSPSCNTTSIQEDSQQQGNSESSSKIKIKLYAKIKLDKSITTKQAFISPHLYEQIRNRILKEFPNENINIPSDTQLLIYISNQVHEDEIPKCNKLKAILQNSPNNSQIEKQILQNTKLLRELLNIKSKRYNTCFQSHCIYRIEVLEMILYFQVIGYSKDDQELSLFNMTETCTLIIDKVHINFEQKLEILNTPPNINHHHHSMTPPTLFRTIVKSITSQVPIYHKIISQLIYLILNENSHILIHGEEGVGKTYLVHHTLSQLESIMSSNHVGIYIEKNEISASELFHGGVGESENAFKQLLLSKPIIDKKYQSVIKVIVIDDIDNILTSNSRYESGRVDRSMISELVHFFDIQSLNPSHHDCKTILIGLTSHLDRVDGSLIRSNRFSRLFELKVPSPQQRMKILNEFILSNKSDMKSIRHNDTNLHMRACQLETQGFVWSDFVKLQSLIELDKMEFHSSRSSSTLLDWHSLKHFIRKCKPKSSWTLQDSSTTSSNSFEEIQMDPSTTTPPITTTLNSQPTNIQQQDFFSMNLAGMDSIIAQVKLSVIYPFLYYEKYVKLGIQAPKGLLIYGPHGTGKTLLATCIARECKANFISVQCPDILSKVVGESSKAIKQLFVMARKCAPCILFFDQFDAIATSRNAEHSAFSSSSSSSSDKMLSTLLIEMDGVHQHKNPLRREDHPHDDNEEETMRRRRKKMDLVQLNMENMKNEDEEEKETEEEEELESEEYYSLNNSMMIQNDQVFILAATNRLDLLDSAILRPGRIDQHIHLPLPNQDARMEILKLKTRGMPIQDHEECIREMAHRTHNFSGADLDNLCREAAMLCLRENMNNEKISRRHFEMALQTMRK